MTEYYPNCWVVIRMHYKEEVVYKVLGGWSGNYTQGDSWRLNSGIKKAEYDIAKDVWKFYGSSGSVYVCQPDQYKLGLSTYPVWNQMLEKHPNNVRLLENQNWETVDWSV